MLRLWMKTNHIKTFMYLSVKVVCAFIGLYVYLLSICLYLSIYVCLCVCFLTCPSVCLYHIDGNFHGKIFFNDYLFSTFCKQLFEGLVFSSTNVILSQFLRFLFSRIVQNPQNVSLSLKISSYMICVYVCVLIFISM